MFKQPFDLLDCYSECYELKSNCDGIYAFHALIKNANIHPLNSLYTTLVVHYGHR